MLLCMASDDTPHGAALLVPLPCISLPSVTIPGSVASHSRCQESRATVNL
jgi:hypothetical protein